MITKIEIDGFKSFKDFRMEFTPLTIIAGLNASGKSNLFDALQLQDISGLYQSIGQSISLEALRKLPSFGKFEDNVRNAFRELKYLN